MMKFGRAAFAAMLVTASPVALAQLTPSDAEQASGTDDIIVTGEKANRTLQDTPASVAVVTQASITAQNLISVYDALERIPNLSVGASRGSFSIRGIDAINVTGFGEGALASVYVDGAVLPRIALTAGPLDLYDIAQIEVFRGPQSTVQGRNALAGAIIVRTTDPGYEWSGRARVLLTDQDGQRRAGAAIGGPIVDGEVAFRLAGEIARSDGLIRNVTRHEDGDSRASETIRAKLLLTPNAAPNLRIVATYLHDHHRRGTYYSEFTAPYTPRQRIATENVADILDITSDIGTLEAGYDLGGGFNLTSVTNYSNVRSVFDYDLDRGPSPTQRGNTADPTKTFQQEMRLNLRRSWVYGLVGGYYLRDDNRRYFLQSRQELNLRNLGVDRLLRSNGLPQPVVDVVLNQYGGVVPIATTFRQQRLTSNYAGFADLTFPVTDRLRLIGGLRYDRESQDRGTTQTVVFTRPLPNPANAPAGLGPVVALVNTGLNATAAAANTVQPVRTVTYNAWLPKAGATYDVATDVSLSLTAQRGYRAGGSGLNQARGTYFEYDPEYTWNYELALRSQWLDRRLTLNANAYYIDWTAQQVSVQLTPGSLYDTQTVNAGKSRLYGAELEMNARPIPQLSVFAGVGYSNTRFLHSGSSATLVRFIPGNEFSNAPHWTVSGGTTWQHPSGLFANLNANYRSGFFRDVVDQPALPPLRDVGGRTLVNAKLGFQGKHYGAFLVASNIFDVAEPTQTFLDQDRRIRGVLTDPRILGLSFEGRF